MRILFFLLVAIGLGGCASKSVMHMEEVDVSASQPPMRYVAWLQGDFQNEYEGDRQVASSRLANFEKNPPDMKDTESYLEYVSLLDASRKYKAAGMKLRQFLLIYPNETRAIFLLGCHYLRMKKKELGRYLFSQLENNPKFPWKSLLLNNLGMMALGDRDRRSAIEYFRRATKAKPSIAAPYVNLGSLYLQSLSYAQAEKVFKIAYNIDKDFEDALVGRAVSLEGQGDFNAAHDAYNGFIKSHPESLTALYNDAIILGKKLNRRSEAAQLLLRYTQRGGKATAKANKLIQIWR